MVSGYGFEFGLDFGFDFNFEFYAVNPVNPKLETGRPGRLGKPKADELGKADKPGLHTYNDDRLLDVRLPGKL